MASHAGMLSRKPMIIGMAMASHHNTVACRGSNSMPTVARARPSFTDFTRSYETVIYGIGVCDERRFASLSALAAGLLNILPSRNNKHAQGSSGSHHAAP